MAAVQLTVAHRRAAQKKKCEESFADFVVLAWPHADTQQFVPNWHIRVLANHLQAVFEGRIRRLLINIPPGSAKSLIVSVLFPAWCWTRDPRKKIISAAHNRALSNRDSMRCRRLIESHWYRGLWPMTLADDQNAKGNFENDQRGARVAMALTAMTGERGNIVIIDDPHSVDDAKSEAYRRTAVETFLEAVPSRVNDPVKDAIIVVMQRLHQEDVAGAILDRPQLGYDHLCLPLFAPATPYPATSIGFVDQREEGENLFPDRYTVGYIAEQRASLGPWGFAGQYQQTPVPPDDGFFERGWFKRYHAADLPKSLNYFLMSDHAPGGKGDYNVFRIWGVDSRRNLYLADSFRKKCLMDEAMGIERDPKTGMVKLLPVGALPLIRKWKPLGWYPENDNTWVAIKSFVHAAMLETDTFCSIKPLATKGSGDKMGKAQPFQAMASMGLVHLPVGQVGDDALEEYVMFGPTCRHDDQVDADGAIARVLDQALPAYIAAVEIKREVDPYEPVSASEGWY